MNGYTVVVDNDLNTKYNKNININNGALIVTGNMTCNDANLKIETGLLIVKCNLTQHCNMYVNNGKVEIGGNCSFASGTFDAGAGVLKIGGNFKIENYQYTYFVMSQEKAYILVNGDFTINSECKNKNITAGTLEVKGDFYQKGSEINSDTTNYNEAYNFPASGTHKVILSGTEEQVVSFDAPKYSYFNILVKKNPNITLKTSCYKYLFDEIPYIVNFETNTSKGTITKILDSTNKISVTSQINLLGNLSKNGYYFKGWYLDEKYTIPLTAENDIIASDMALYAKWAEPMSFDNVSYFSENNEIFVNVVLDEELETQSEIVIIAIYDESKLITAYHTEAEETVSYTFENIPVAENGYTVKAFCWSDSETLIPLCNSIHQQIQ